MKWDTCVCLLTFGWTAGSLPPMANGVPNPPPHYLQLNIIIPPEWKCFRDTWASRGWQSYFEGGVLLFTWLAMRDKRAPADMYSTSDTETCQDTETDWGGCKENLVPVEERAWGRSQCRIFYQFPVGFEMGCHQAEAGEEVFEACVRSKLQFKPDLFKPRATP